METQTSQTRYEGRLARVLGAESLSGGSIDHVPDEEIRVRLCVEADGPVDLNGAPWGPTADFLAPMSEVSGPVEYARPGGLMTILRKA